MSNEYISPEKIHQHLAQYRTRSVTAAVVFFVYYCLLYLAACCGVVLLAAAYAKLLCGLAAGLLSGKLFLIGHDACHGAYTRYRWLNKLIGRVAFLPSRHPYSLWQLGHNKMHHTFTNLKGRDFVWTPLSKAEFDALPRVRKLLYRFYRNTFGFGFYYLHEIWWDKMFFPRPHRLDKPKRIYRADCWLVCGFLMLEAALAITLTAQLQPHLLVDYSHWLALLFFGLLMPFLFFSWMIGFVVFFNHTHPVIPWFSNAEEWSFLRRQIGCTVHLRFPAWMRFFTGDVMDHTAHHLNPRIPLARLKEAQHKVGELLHGKFVVQEWSLQVHNNIVASCKLYDYDKHVWLDFEGIPTSPSPCLSSHAHIVTG